ncbi:MAG: dynamin family protein [Bacillota bacterium]
MEFKQVRKQIIENYDYILTSIDENNFKKRIKDSKKRLFKEEMSLLVVGEFSRGKSTFINTLLSAPVLPSKVNPTTASINIIKPSEKRRLLIHKQKEVLTYDIPEKEPRVFLNEYVTSENENIEEISKIVIEWPSLLNKLDCKIIDTPGVNDLDELRENITYNYLSKADACIVMLDAQQPFTKSEEKFIKNKILNNDIHRLIFVINRCDDITSSPQNEDIKRIKKYVINKLEEKIPSIKEPLVLGVSSLQALIDRYNGENGAWNVNFKNFEKKLNDFINEKALNNRLDDHIYRYKNLLNDIKKFYLSSLEDSEKTKEELQQEINIYLKKEKLLDKTLISFKKMINNGYMRLETDLEELLDEFIYDTKNKFNQKYQRSESTEEIIEFLQNTFKIFTEEINEIIFDFRKKLITKIRKELEIELPLDENKISIKKNLSIDNIEFSEEKENIIDKDSLKIAGAVGIAAGILLGPITGILGAQIAYDKFKEKSVNKNKLIRDKLYKSFKEIKQDAKSNIKKILKKEKDYSKIKVLNIIKDQIKYRRSKMNEKKEIIKRDQNKKIKQIKKNKEIITIIDNYLDIERRIWKK